MDMKKNKDYSAPECEAFELRLEGVICGSKDVNGNLIPPGYDDGGNLPF